MTEVCNEVWVFCETKTDRWHETAPKMASEAARLGRLLGAAPCGLLIGAELRPLAAALECWGLRRLYLVAAALPHPLSPEACALALGTLLRRRQPRLLLCAATPMGSEIAARLAAAAGYGLIANCVDFELEGDRIVARKPIHNGRAHLTLTWAAGPPHLATVHLGSLEAHQAPLQPLEIIEEQVDCDGPSTRLIAQWPLPWRELDVAEAQVVLGVGRGVRGPAELAPLERLAARLGAALGGSKLAVEKGLLPRERQIGASGKWIAPDVYLTAGISGASHHLMGTKGVKHLVAINTDRSAPILRVAELGVVGDLNEVVPALLALLEDGATR